MAQSLLMLVMRKSMGLVSEIPSSSLMLTWATTPPPTLSTCRMTACDWEWVMWLSTPLLFSTRPHAGRSPSLPTSQCVSSHLQSSPNANSSTTDTTVHHSTHTHRVTNCASKCMLMVMVMARVLMCRYLLFSWEGNMTSTSSGHSQVTLSLSY